MRARQRTGSRAFGGVFKVGDLIANRYRVVDILGSGGAGVVYRARDQEIDVDVAVKVINQKLVQTGEEQRLFSRQTKIAKKLSHQNVVRIYDEGRDEERPFFTMQLLEGLSLRKIIDLRREKEQAFALAEIEPIFNQLCHALDYAHKTTFHGDLKPDNVIVLPDLLKVTDFALLRGLPRKPFLAIQKSRGANFRYLAPEVRLEVTDLDRQVDVYSLGAILCEMLTGVVFDDGRVDHLSSLAGLDPSLLVVLKRALGRAPKDRYASAGELYEDVRSSLARGVARAASSRVSAKAEVESPELETQRLDISQHGARPVADGQPVSVMRDELAASPSAAVDAVDRGPEIDPDATFDIGPPLVAPSLPAPGVEASPAREFTGSFATIGDEMIESASASLSAARVPGAGQVDGRGADQEEEPFVDSDSETEALLEPIPGLHIRPSDPPELMEISGSAIQLIHDPRKTGLLRLDSSQLAAEATEAFEEGRPITAGLGGPNRTLKPTPLPDSALPSPAFGQVVRDPSGLLAEATRDEATLAHNGRGNSGVVAPMGPDVAVGGLGREGVGSLDLLQEHERRPMTRGRPASPTERTRATSKMPPAKAGNGPKRRPMTRPRMSALPGPGEAAGAPALATQLFEGTQDPARPPTGARPIMVDSGSVVTGTPAPVSIPTQPPASATQLPASAPPATPALTSQRIVLLTFGLSVLAVLVAILVVFKLQSDQQAAHIAQLSQQILEVQRVAQAARENEERARREALMAGENANAARQAEEDAARAAQEAVEKRALAEKEAKAREAEAKRLAALAAASADDAKKAEAERAARAAQLEAERHRKAADDQAAREREERERAERERARREKEESAQKAAEERASREAAAKAKAEDRARALNAEQGKKPLVAEDTRRGAEAETPKREEPTDDKRKSGGEAAAGVAAVVPAAASGGTCPKGMAFVEAGSFMLGAARNDPERNFGDLEQQAAEVRAFCVDYYEFPNGRERVPSSGVSFKAAQQQCKAKGKRLCSEVEWERACKGPSGTRFPYGNQWDPTACATEDDEGNDRGVGKSGDYKRCRSGFNVFDMSGNLAEWTSTEMGAGAYVVKGGSADRPGYDGRCAARKKKKASDADSLLGFRCCADPT